MEPQASEIGILNRQPVNVNFLQGLKFKFFIWKLPNTNYFVQKCNLAGMSVAAAMQPTPLQNLPLPGTTLSYNDLVVTFRINADFSNYLELFTWINGEGFPKDTQEYADLKKENIELNSEFGGIISDASIYVLNNNDVPIINILYRDAFITRLSDVYFDSTTESSDYLVCDATLKFAWIDVEKFM